MSRRVYLIIAGDIACAVFALFTSYLIRFGVIPDFHDISHEEISRAVLFVVIVLFTSFLLEVYSIAAEIGQLDLLIRILLAIIGAFFIITAISYLTNMQPYGRGLLILSLLTFALLQMSWHIIIRIGSTMPGFVSNVLVLGTGPLARQIGTLITSKKHSYSLAGYVNSAAEPVTVPFHSIVSTTDGLYESARRLGAHKIVVSFSERRGVFPLQDVLNCKLKGIEITDAPTFYEQMTGKLLLENITPSWFIFSHGFRVTVILRLLKRLTDILTAMIGLFMFLPFLPFIALLIRFDSPGPILFRQQRVGEGECSFYLFKFRTMRQDAESKTGAVWAIEKDPRVTRVGNFLRKSRIDEIPQLFNVLKGDMSMVGPRPERPEFVSKLKEVIPYYSERHYVKPGVTGWAQVCYPYGASVEDAIEKLRYDLYYIKNISLTFDILIILETIKVVLFRKGAR